MPDYGLLPTGLSIPTIQDIRDGIEADMRDEFGNSIPLGDRTWIGHLIGIMSERVGLVWEGVEAVYSSQDPDKATAAALRVIGKYTGTFETAASPSSVTGTLCGDDGTVVAEGFTVATDSTAKQFETVDDCELDQLDAWVALTLYDVDDRVTNSSRCYVCITAGTSAGSQGPIEADADETDGTVHWRYMGEGEAAVDVELECTEDGPVECTSGDLTVIITPVGGVSSAINLEDADLGNDVQTDEEFRVMREVQLAEQGAGTPDAIRAAMLEVSGVTSCTVFFNNTDETVDDLPPHSVEVLVKGGDDADIFQAVWDNVPSGIQAIGDEEGTVEDAEGFDQAVAFSRPEEIDIWVIVTLEKIADDYEGDSAVEDAIVAWGDEQQAGRNAVASMISRQSFVDGVIDVSEVLIGLVNPPTLSTTIQITRRQLAVYDTARITVASSDGEP